MSNIGPRAPSGLGARGRKLWREVVGKYQLDPAELSVLEELAHTVDELARLNVEAAVAPLMIGGSKGQQVPNPLFAQVLRHRKTVEALSRSLALPADGEQVGSYRNPHRKAAVASGG